MTRVEQLWQDIGAQSEQPGLFRRVDETHPLNIYAGLDFQCRRVLMLITTEQPSSLPPPGVVQITCNQRADGGFATILQLARPEYDELFGRLCQDLVDATRDVPPDQGGAALLRRLGRWRRLLEVGQRHTLSDAEFRGLVGELQFLISVAIPRFGVDAAVNGWLGPFDSPQDFSLGGTMIEVKTCTPGTQRVTISSLQQLDVATEPFYLAVIWIAPADGTTTEDFTASQLVASIRVAIESSSSATTEFALRLADAGYVECEEYERVWFRIARLAYFSVNGIFPRLVRSAVPVGVLDATYTLDLAACGPFECAPYGVDNNGS